MLFNHFPILLFDAESTGGSDAPKETQEVNHDDEIAELRKKLAEKDSLLEQEKTKNSKLWNAHEAVKNEKKELKDLLKQNKTHEKEQEQHQVSVDEIETRYKNQMADLETQLSERDNQIKELGFKHSREKMIDKLDKALLENGADPECVEFLRQKLITSGKVQETVLENGSLDFKFLDASGKYEYRDRETNDWKLYDAQNIAKEMAESGTYDKWFLSQKAAGFGGDVSVTHRQATRAQQYQEEYKKLEGNPGLQRALLLQAQRENIKIKT